MTTRFKRVLVTGGGGYVGSVLVPKLLAAGHGVNVLDLFLYGEDVLDAVKGDPKLRLVKGDLRHLPTVEAALADCDAVIHLACISNDPSFELDPELGQVDQSRRLPPARARRQGGAGQALRLCLFVFGLRDQGGGRGNRGPAARAADRLFQIQGGVRAHPGAKSGRRALSP